MFPNINTSLRRRRGLSITLQRLEDPPHVYQSSKHKNGGTRCILQNPIHRSNLNLVWEEDSLILEYTRGLSSAATASFVLSCFTRPIISKELGVHKASGGDAEDPQGSFATFNSREQLQRCDAREEWSLHSEAVRKKCSFSFLVHL